MVKQQADYNDVVRAVQSMEQDPYDDGIEAFIIYTDILDAMGWDYDEFESLYYKSE